MRRTFYQSSNGDSWALVLHDSGTVEVVHTPNVASGGQLKGHEIANFLSRERNSAENHELRRLIGTLVEEKPDA
jgi:hypothetical protein